MREIILFILVILFLFAFIWGMVEVVKESSRNRKENREREKAIFWECMDRTKELNWCFRVIGADL